MPIGNDASASIELRQSACARVARVSTTIINRAMRGGELPYYKDREGFRVTTWDSLFAWMDARTERAAR